MSPSPLCRVCRQVPPLLPDRRVLEHREAVRLLHHQVGWDPGRLGLPLQAEQPLPQPEGWVPSGSRALGRSALPCPEQAEPGESVPSCLHGAGDKLLNLELCLELGMPQKFAHRLLLLASMWVCLCQL